MSSPAIARSILSSNFLLGTRRMKYSSSAVSSVRSSLRYSCTAREAESILPTARTSPIERTAPLSARSTAAVISETPPNGGIPLVICIVFAVSVSASIRLTVPMAREGRSARASSFEPSVGQTDASISRILSNSSVVIALSKFFLFSICTFLAGKKRYQKNRKGQSPLTRFGCVRSCRRFLCFGDVYTDFHRFL